VTGIMLEPDRLEEYAGMSLGPGDWYRITQADVDAFGAATHDQQWIHAAGASGGPFGGPVAHGFLVLSLLSYLTEPLLAVRGAHSAINYRLDRVRFRTPVPVDARVRAAGAILCARWRAARYIEVSMDVAIEIEDRPARALTAEHATLFDVRSMPA
jgi:acyl dehydratase